MFNWTLCEKVFFNAEPELYGHCSWIFDGLVWVVLQLGCRSLHKSAWGCGHGLKRAVATQSIGLEARAYRFQEWHICKKSFSEFRTPPCPSHQIRSTECVSRVPMTALTSLEHQRSGLRTACSPYALLSCACGATSSHGTSSYRHCTTRSTSCPRFMSRMAWQLCLQFFRLGNLQFHFYRFSCLPFYSFSFWVFAAEGLLTHLCNSRPSQ